MNNKVQNIIKIVGFSCLIVFCFVVVIAANMDNQFNAVKTIDADIKNNYEGLFITENEALDFINEQIPDGIIGRSPNELNLSKVEETFNENPYIADNEVYFTQKNELKVSIELRQPICRVLHKNSVSYYIDKNGIIFPLSNKFTARVPIILWSTNGTVNSGDTLKQQIIVDALSLLTYTTQDEFWKEQLDQLVITANNEFEMYPLIGNHKVKIGTIRDFKEKLQKLKIFYTDGLNNVGWSKYSEIDLRFKDQIACKKK